MDYVADYISNLAWSSPGVDQGEAFKIAVDRERRARIE